MVTRTYYSKDAGPKNLYRPGEKELLYNIENWCRIADDAPTPDKRRYALGKVETLEVRLLHFRERQEMRDDAGPQVALEPGYKFPSRGQGSPIPIRGSKG